MKEDLPRIAYANPSLKITVDKLDKKVEDILIPEMVVEFRKCLYCLLSLKRNHHMTLF